MRSTKRQPTASEMITRRDLSSTLGLSAVSVDALVSVGMIPEPVKIGNAKMWVKSDLDPVIHAVPAVRSVPAVMIKVGPARTSDSYVDNGLGDRRPFRGWQAGLDPMHRHQISGINRWHSASGMHHYIGDTLIVTSAGFVLAVYRITDLEALFGYNQFFLDAPSDEAVAAYSGTRFPVTRGSSVQSWGR